MDTKDSIDADIKHLNEEMAITLNDIFKTKTIIETVDILTDVFEEVYIHLKWAKSTRTGFIDIQLICDFKDILGVDYIIENTLPNIEVVHLIEIIYGKNGSVEYIDYVADM
jgi:hypothetical protein